MEKKKAPAMGLGLNLANVPRYEEPEETKGPTIDEQPSQARRGKVPAMNLGGLSMPP